MTGGFCRLVQKHEADTGVANHPGSCHSQIEARARQMEGRDLGQQAATPGGKAQPQTYDRARQGAAPGLASEAKVYNPDADVTATAGKEEKKKVGLTRLAPRLQGCTHLPGSPAAVSPSVASAAIISSSVASAAIISSSVASAAIISSSVASAEVSSDFDTAR